jgi:hypothetical protein
MRKNEAGMSVLEPGDVVRVGSKGKVLYTVLEVLESGTPIIESHTSGKVQQVNPDRLNLVQSAPEPLTGMAELIIPDQTPAGTEPVSDEAWGDGPDVEPVRDPIMPVRESMFSEVEKAAIMRDVDDPTELNKNDHRESVYGRTILGALNRLGKHVYAGTGTSKRRNKAQKKAEKAKRRQARDARRAKYEADRTVV